MGDHELDRRFNDQQFKLDITKEIAKIQADLNHNTEETKETKDAVSGLEKTIKGDGRLDPGLVGQTIENSASIDRLWGFVTKRLWIYGFLLILFADQLAPIIRDWLYQKTKMKVFYSVAQDFKEQKSVPHVKHYTIINKIDPNPKED